MGRTTLAAILLLACAAATRADELSDAAALEQEGRFDDAAVLYEKAAASGPAGVVGLTRVLVRLGKPEEAEAAAAKALETAQGDPALLLARAEARLAVCESMMDARAQESRVMDKAYEGLGWIKKALVKDPKSFDGRLLQARYTGFISGDASDSAREILEQLATERPDSADVWIELGRHYGRKAGSKKNDDLWGKAEGALLKAIEADPRRADAYLNLGRTRGWLARPKEEVADCFEQAACRMAGQNQVLDLLTQWSPTPRAATAALKRIAATRPGDRVVRFYLAFYLSKTRTFREGMNLLDKAAEASPKDAWLAFDRAWYCVLTRKLMFVGDAVMKAVEVGRENPPEGFYGRVDLLALADGLEPEQREAIWVSLHEGFPDQVQTPNNAAVWWRDKGHDFQKSAEWYERAVAIAPEDVGLLNDTGLVYWHPNYLNDPAKAEPFFRRAIAAAKKQEIALPDKSMAYRDAVDNLAKLLTQQKRAKDMRALAEEIKDDPRSGGIRLMADQVEKDQ